MYATKAKVVPFEPRSIKSQGSNALRVTLAEIAADGTLWVDDRHGTRFPCDVLEYSGLMGVPLAAGDSLLALAPERAERAERGIVLGRIGRYRVPAPAQPQPHVTLEATESLTLKCGESSIDLRADGKLMVRGEDVLVRARGTQRIKAGTVNIN